jgi:hypothetical protein
MESLHRSHGDIWGKVFVGDKDVVSRKIGGELFIVPVKGQLADMQKIFTLTPVAEYIWERLDGRKNVSEIRDEVVARFEVSGEQADSDISEFLAELLEARLIHEGTD